MRSEGAALALTLRASKTDFSLPEPTLQAIGACAGNTWLPSRCRSQSAIFFRTGEACARRKLVKGVKPTFQSGCGSDQKPVETFGSDGSDKPLGGRVRFGRTLRSNICRVCSPVRPTGQARGWPGNEVRSPWSSSPRAHCALVGCGLGPEPDCRASQNILRCLRR